MRKLKSIVLFIILLVSFATMGFKAYSDYTDGYKDGHCSGWKDVRGDLAICPIAPIAPIPEAQKNTYKGGYNAGFKQGAIDAKK